MTLQRSITDDDIKICMITTNHSPLDSRIFYKEAKSLKKAGFDVTIIGQNDPDMNAIVEDINIIGIKKGLGLSSYIRIWNKLLKESLKVDAAIYHCHEPESFLVLIYLKLIKNKKVVYDVHEYYPDVIPLASLQMKMFLIFMLYIFEPLFCRYSDAIITADDEIAKRYRKFNQKVHTVYNFPVLDMFKAPNNHELQKKYKDKFVIIYVGGMYEERGILDLIKAVHNVSKTYPYVKLLLLGRFATKGFENKCIEYIESNQLYSVIELLGFVPHNVVPMYINVSDVGAVLLKPIPKFYKNIPIKQFEYMICKKPVIGSDLPPIEKFVGKEGAGILVNPNDIDEISETIIYLIKNPKERCEMGDRGKKAIENMYNWSRMEEKLIGIYSKIRG